MMQSEMSPAKERTVTVVNIAVWVVALAFCGFQLYTSIFGTFEAYLQREVHLLFALVLLFIVLPGLKKRRRELTVNALDILLILGVIFALGYLLIRYRYYVGLRVPYVTPLTTIEYVVTILLVLVVLEGTRRSLGLALPIVAVVFILYVFVGRYLPGIFHTSVFSFSMIMDLLVLSKNAVFGIALGVSATYLFVFILFGQALSESGFGSLLMAVAKAVTGRTRGGPAKIAVLASALFGTISGSSTSNAVTTGSMTIPLMKRMGFSAEFASGVEAAASTGGQIMPPMLGAAALVMVTFAGVPYTDIIKWSILPAVLYFAGVWFMVDLRSARKKLSGTAEKVEWKKELKEKWHLILPIVVLLVFLFSGRTIMLSGVAAVFSVYFLANIRKTTRMSWKKNVLILRQAAIRMLPIAMATATSGIIVGIVGLTGLGNRFSMLIVDASGHAMFIALLFTMVAGLIIGMGMPTAPAYIVQVALIVPALIKIGLPAYVAHLFVVYFAPMSMITPPVAITAFAAAGVGGANQMKTGWTAVKLALAGFIVPFMFAYNQNLLLEGLWYNVVLSTVTAGIGIFALAFSLEGYWLKPLNFIERIFGFAAALLLIFPGWPSDLTGAAIVVILIISQRLLKTWRPQEAS